MNFDFTMCSKYILILLASFFVVFDYFILFIKNDENPFKATFVVLQRFFVLFICVVGNISLVLARSENIYWLYMFMQILYFAIIFLLIERIYKSCDRLLINNTSFFLSVGFLMISRLDGNKFIKQFLFAFAGIIILIVVPILVKKLSALMRFKYVFCLMGIVLLSLVLVLGNTVYGANLSLTLGSFSFQPSEIVKITFILFVAGMLAKSTDMKNIIVTSVLAAIHVLILVASNDVGTAFIFFATYVVILFDVTKKKRYLFLGAAGTLFAFVAAYFLIPHIKNRIIVWLDPFKYIDNKGYQLVQGIFAMINGGLLGTGLNKGLPGSIPVVTKDFIFPAIGEEFGLIFCILLIMAYLCYFYEIVKIMSGYERSLNRILLGGFAIMFIVQVFVNIGGVTMLVPCTGVTLSYISYGGSSILSNFLMLGIIQGLSNPGENNKNILNGRNEEEENNSNNRNHSSPRMIIGGAIIAVLLCFGVLNLYCRYDIGTLDSTYNKRLSKMEMTTIPGNMYAAGGEVLADTLIGENGELYRDYPYGELFAHVIGYNYYDGAGLEGQLKRRLLLSGQDIITMFQNDILGQKYVGDGIYTTLDVAIQNAAYKALGDYNGAVVVMNTDGRVLAMVSKPDFNPNTLLKQGYDKDKDAPLLNRAVNGLYPPGSTFKPVTLLEYYRECRDLGRLDKFYNYSYECTGIYSAGENSVSCVSHTAHGIVGTIESMAHSCNGSFINMGLTLNIEKFNKTAEKLGFNKDIFFLDGYGIGITKSSFNLNSDSTEWDVIQTSFGQGETLVTPIHNALMMQAVANGGIMYKPYLVDRIISVNGKTMYSYTDSGQERVYGQAMAEIESKMIAEHLRAVITDGFEHVFGEAPYECAGKSGTAQYGTDGYEHSLFVGYMPYDNPEIIVSVVLEGFNTKGTSDKYAVNVAKEIFDIYYEIMGKSRK